jgi:hypothetical protein
VQTPTPRESSPSMDQFPSGASTSRSSAPRVKTGKFAAVPSKRSPSMQPRAIAARTDVAAEKILRAGAEDPNAVRVKGINFITFLEAISRSYGPLARQRIEQEAPGELGNALRFGGIVAGGWYKIGWYRALWHLIGEQFALDEAGVRRLSHKATAIGVNVVYRTLAKVTTPTILISISARIFGYYFDKGQLAVLESEPGRAVAEWTNCNGFDTYVWNHVAGGTIYFLGVAGAKTVEFNRLGGGGDANWMRCVFTYR